MNLASCDPLGVAFGARLGRLGDLLGRLGAILGVLERSFGDSGLFWTVLGASWAVSGAVLELQNEPGEPGPPLMSSVWGHPEAVRGQGGSNCRFGVPRRRL